MAQTARREHFGYLLEPLLHSIFFDVYDSIPELGPSLYNVQTTDEPFLRDVGIGAMGEFPEFKGTVEYDRPYQGYEYTYEFPEFAKGFSIERRLYDDDRYNVINKQPPGLAIEAKRRRESDAAALFNNAFAGDTNAASFLGGDGVTLCSDSHPSKANVDNPGSGPAARSNVGSLPLNHANLQTTKNLMRQFQNDRGGKISVVPDLLLVGLDDEEMGWELIQSEKKIETADNNPNIHHGKYTLMVWDYLDNDGRWFLIDSRYMKMFLSWYDRVPIEFGAGDDFDTLVAKFRAYMRYGAGFSDWVWCFGNIPA